MARKSRKKRSWFKILLIFVFTPVVVWALAFIFWFYWGDITKRSTGDKRPTQAVPKVTRQPEPAVKKPSEEKILEEDRKKLDKILKDRR